MIMDYQVHPFSFNEVIKYMQAVYDYLFIYLLSCLPFLPFPLPAL